jgi:hypothetical protein
MEGIHEVGLAVLGFGCTSSYSPRRWITPRFRFPIWSALHTPATPAETILVPNSISMSEPDRKVLNALGRQRHSAYAAEPDQVRPAHRRGHWSGPVRLRVFVTMLAVVGTPVMSKLPSWPAT